MLQRERWRRYATVLLVLVGGASVLYVLQARNYLLFHSVVEMVSILVAFSVFVLTWNAIADIESSFIAILGVSYLFVGGIDLLHTLAYKGMGVFPAAGTDLPTQLWVFGRYTEAGSLLGAALVGYATTRQSSVNVRWNERTLSMLAAGYALVVAAGLASMFAFDLFPTAHVEGSGLTRFKVVSEYVIVALLAASFGVLYSYRRQFTPRVFQLFAASLALAIGAELAFTSYVDVYGLSNAAGHFFKLGSFYLMYLAVVKTGIRDPQKTLYREISRREAEARKFKKVADYSGHGIMITDADGTIQYVNRAWEEMSGYAADEAVGRTPKLLQSDEHDEAFFEDLWSTILSGDVWEGEVVNERRDGEQFVIYQTIAPILGDDGEIEHFVAVNDEITEQKAYEQHLEQGLERSVRQLQVLARVLRHNIRNETTVIIGNAEIVKREADGDLIERATSIIDASERLLTQAEKQRDVVELLMGSSNVRAVSIPEVVHSVADRLADRHPDAAIRVDVPEDLRARTIPELEVAIEELVENAVVHSDPDAAAVTVEAHGTDGALTVRVRDDGPGIPTPERQVVSGTEDIDALLHGSGMGLWLVKQIVTRAGGTLRFAESDPRGTVVTLTIPRRPAPVESTPTLATPSGEASR